MYFCFSYSLARQNRCMHTSFILSLVLTEEKYSSSKRTRTSMQQVTTPIFYVFRNQRTSLLVLPWSSPILLSKTRPYCFTHCMLVFRFFSLSCVVFLFCVLRHQFFFFHSTLHITNSFLVIFFFLLSVDNIGRKFDFFIAFFVAAMLGRLS